MRRIAERLDDMHAVLAVLDVRPQGASFGLLREGIARLTARPTSDARVRAAIELARERGEWLVCDRVVYRLGSIDEYASWCERNDAFPAPRALDRRGRRSRRRPQQMRLIAA